MAQCCGNNGGKTAADGPTVTVPSVFTTAALSLGVVVTVLLGVAPQPLLDLADHASVFLR